MTQAQSKAQNNFRIKFKNYIKSQDIFGHQISFTYKNSSTFKSFLGGIVTLIFRIAVLVYLVTELINAMQKKSTISNSTYIRNIAEDFTVYEMTNQKFDLAFQIQLDGAYAPQDLSKFLEFTFSEIGFEWAPDGKSYKQNYREIPLIRCPNGRFNNETIQTDNIKLTESYLCHQTIDFKFKVAQKKNITCGTEAEINSVFDRLSINVGLMNQFVDVNDKSSNPIKTLIKSLYMTSNSIQQTRKYGHILVTLTTTRVVYTVADALSTTGGFLGIISIILNYLLCWFQVSMFYQSIVHDMFFVEKQNDKKKVGKSDKSQTNLKLFPSLEQKKRLFQIARKKIDKRLEIERIFETMKTASLLNKIILSKYQRKLTPFFRSSLVRSKVDLSDIKKIDQKLQMGNKKEEVSEWPSMSKLLRKQVNNIDLKYRDDSNTQNKTEVQDLMEQTSYDQALNSQFRVNDQNDSTPKRHNLRNSSQFSIQNEDDLFVEKIISDEIKHMESNIDMSLIKEYDSVKSKYNSQFKNN
ncbi:UNKNOWN [Stylonychia lemnae]|uniref:Transmembrane protein n=1 Tax=Stylonychia lemnae TaxID=5949 RepID=A0A078A1W5_STYLE|nr:UNKNOWN [Stylonychia lemnae]|eukprot:CDW76231.1 UNKNOWN [Stylonychia lemnae]